MASPVDRSCIPDVVRALTAAAVAWAVIAGGAVALAGSASAQSSSSTATTALGTDGPNGPTGPNGPSGPDVPRNGTGPDGSPDPDGDGPILPDGALPPQETRPAPVVVVDDPRISPELGAVPLESEEYDRAVAAYLDVQSRRNAAAAVVDRSVDELTELLAAQLRLRDQRNVATRRLAKSERRLVDLRAELGGVAVDAYVTGGLGGPVEGSFDADESVRLGLRRVYVSAVHHDQLAEQEQNLSVVEEMGLVLATTDAEDRATAQRITELEATRDRASDERAAADALLPARKRAVADARLLADVVGLDFSLVVFNAYFLAAKREYVDDPTCGIRWQALAGIGRTESHHGTYAGGYVDADGNLTEPIYGIDLDGSNGTALVPDSDEGELDLRDDIDRAVGPMQFIPQTWRAFARDGNGDGKADPQNYYDTNLTAARYLCRQGPGLERDDGMRRAFRSYNDDSTYVELVLDRTHAYDRYRIPAIGDDTGPPLPPPDPGTTTTTRPKPSTTTTTDDPDDPDGPGGPSSTTTTGPAPTTTSSTLEPTTTTTDPEATTTTAEVTTTA